MNFQNFQIFLKINLKVRQLKETKVSFATCNNQKTLSKHNYF
jgi:hypothetical protein